MRQGFTPTIDQLAEKLIAIDQTGVDVYFACATYKDGTSRRAHNALQLNSFYADMDCGEGKPYATQEDAIQALDDYSNARGLPLPLVVRSGYGVHGYWVLTKPISAEKWKHVANLLKGSFAAFGLKADPARTADVSSILRPPGTHNYKRGGRVPVTCDGEYEAIDCQEFERLIQTPGERTSAAALSAQDTQPTATLTGSLNDAILNSESGSKFSLNEGVKEGGRNNQCASMAGHLFGLGKSLDEVKQLLLAWNKKNQPPMPDQEVITTVESIYRKDKTKPQPVVALQNIEIPLRRMPAGFVCPDPKGPIFFVKEEEQDDGSKKTSYVPTCAFGLHLIDVCRREGAVVHGAYVFANWHPHNGWHTFSVTTEEFNSGQWVAVMAKNHTDILNPKLFKQYAQTQAIIMKGENMDKVRYEQFGWKDNYNAFLVGNALIKRGGTAEYAYGDGMLEPRMKAMALAKNTSLSAWSAAANRLYAPGFEAHGFALLAGFAAPLMSFVCDETDGGAILALFSEQSGVGKSKILEALASIWGAYDALSVSRSDTDNAKIRIITTACHLPVYEEEMTAQDPIRCADWVKRFTEGRDKNRANKDGSVEMKENRYQTILISASNNSLYEILKLSGDEGAIARVFELQFETPTNKEDFRNFARITSEMLANAGHAGRQYIYSLMYPGVLEWVQQELRREVDALIEHLKTSPAHRFVIRMFACCKIAAKIVNATSLLTFDTDRVINWALAKAQERINDKFVASPLETLGAFINENLEGCLTVNKPHNPKDPSMIMKLPQRGTISMRMEISTGRLYITMDALRTWLQKRRRSMEALMKELENEGVLLRRSSVKVITAGTDWPALRVPVIEIDATHPELSGTVREVVTEIPQAGVKQA